MAATTIIINDETPRRQYTATSGQTVFDFPIPFFEEGDLTVFLTPAGNTADDAADLLTITTDYTVNGADTQDGGEIVLTTGATAGDIITIIREVDIARTTDYQAAGDLLAETLNREQDINIMIAQQLRADHAGIVSRAVSSSSTADLTLPEPDGNYILGWNAAADGLRNFQEIGTYKGTDATTTTSAYVIRDLVKDSSNNNVYICTANSPSGTALTNTSYWKLIVDAASATSSASAAAASATAAASSATAAAASETAAAASESAAGTSETNAASSASAASTSATNAASSASAASSSASAASTSETNAAASETAAAASESAAATSASNAATSETNAAGSATTATTQASAASTSATNAATSASAAATSASNAATSESNAATSASAAQAALDSIENFYLGASATAPTVDDNGDPLAAGDWYFNTTDNLTYIYNGSSWQVTVTSTSGLLQASNNLSDLNSAATALTNLGLTATATELNYTDGVTSAIQTQLDTKASTGKAIAMAIVFGG
jgi:chemotaxis protein histidine kinase CheA